MVDSNEFIKDCEKSGVQVISKGMEHQRAWGVVERTNDVLRKSFKKAFLADETKSRVLEDLVDFCSHYVNGACASKNPYLLGFGRMTRQLSNQALEFEVMENRERPAVSNVPRTEAERNKFRNSYLESRRQNMPTSCDDFVRTRFNIAGCLTKIMNADQMDEGLATGLLNHEVAEYIIADENLPISDTLIGNKEVDLLPSRD